LILYRDGDGDDELEDDEDTRSAKGETDELGDGIGTSMLDGLAVSGELQLVEEAACDKDTFDEGPLLWETR
jgi:hypothetical protein